MAGACSVNVSSFPRGGLFFLFLLLIFLRWPTLLTTLLFNSISLRGQAAGGGAGVICEVRQQVLPRSPSSSFQDVPVAMETEVIPLQDIAGF